MEIKGLIKLVEQLRAKAAKSLKEDNCSVSVGYTAKYALFVHENLQARHAGNTIVSYASGIRREYTGVGQAKFLEQPARELNNSGELGRIVVTALLRRKTVAQALLLAGLRIQRESQLLCAVDTGAMRASAF